MKTLLGILCLVFLEACCLSGVKKEVSLDVSFSPISDYPVFEKIKAEGANRPIELTTATDGSLTFSRFRLPVNSNADSSRYFFL